MTRIQKKEENKMCQDMPVYFVGVGEGIDDLLKFDAQSFIDGIV